jgi:general secretion pathway protein A
MMYQEFFELREDAFRVNPDPRYLYCTPATQEALASLAYGVQSRGGIAVLTGEVGTGKTTLLHRLQDWLHQNRAATAYLSNTRLNAAELFDCIMADFAIPCGLQNKSAALIQLSRWLLDKYRLGETAVLIVDEAQNLSEEVLEEIRLLSNLETATEKLLQIILSGQPELERTLKRTGLRQLRQRITTRCRTLPLSFDETQGYIARRLSIAGANGNPIFAAGAMESVYSYSHGIPRVTNLLCQQALLRAFAERTRPVPAALVEEVAQEFELERNEQEGLPGECAPSGKSCAWVSGDLLGNIPRTTAREAYVAAQGKEGEE